MPTARTPDTDLYFELTGQGAPVLLIQGVGVAGTAWRPQVDALSSAFEMMTFDNRGLGSSQPCRGPVTVKAMADDARALLDHRGWESAHVVGHSMGGVIAQQLALDAPSRVRSLSLLCTFARGKDGARPTPWVIWMTLRTRLGPRSWRRRAFLEMLVPAATLRTANVPDLAARLGSLIGRDLSENPPIVMRQVRALARHDTSTRLGELRGIPTLVISAELDPIAPPRYGEALAEAIPGARFLRIPNASHAVTLHDPQTVNEPLNAFLSASDSRWTSNPNHPTHALRTQTPS